MQVIIDGHIAQYMEVGSGPTVLVLHGWGDRASTLELFAKALAGEYRFILLDLPGFGGSSPPPSAWGLDEYADFVAAFLAKIAVSPLAVVGHSNGGAIAVRGIATGKFSCQKLLLLASAGIRNVDSNRKTALKLATKIAKLLTLPLPAGVRQKLRAKLYTRVGSDMLVAEHMQDTFRRIVADDVQEDARKVSTPALLIYGENDTATPPRYGEMLQKNLQHARLAVVKDAGHFVFIDQPQEVVTLAKEFLGA